MKAFFDIIIGLFNDWKTYALMAFNAAGIARIAWEGFKYKSADEHERLEIKRTIKNTLVWFIGIPLALWLASYLFQESMKVVNKR